MHVFIPVKQFNLNSRDIKKYINNECNSFINELPLNIKVKTTKNSKSKEIGISFVHPKLEYFNTEIYIYHYKDFESCNAYNTNEKNTYYLKSIKNFSRDLSIVEIYEGGYHRITVTIIDALIKFINKRLDIINSIIYENHIILKNNLLQWIDSNYKENQINNNFIIQLELEGQDSHYVLNFKHGDLIIDGIIYFDKLIGNENNYIKSLFFFWDESFQEEYLPDRDFCDHVKMILADISYCMSAEITNGQQSYFISKYYFSDKPDFLETNYHPYKYSDLIIITQYKNHYYTDNYDSIPLREFFCLFSERFADNDFVLGELQTKSEKNEDLIGDYSNLIRTEYTNLFFDEVSVKAGKRIDEMEIYNYSFYNDNNELIEISLNQTLIDEICDLTAQIYSSVLSNNYNIDHEHLISYLDFCRTNYAFRINKKGLEKILELIEQGCFYGLSFIDIPINYNIEVLIKKMNRIFKQNNYANNRLFKELNSNFFVRSYDNTDCSISFSQKEDLIKFLQYRIRRMIKWKLPDLKFNTPDVQTTEKIIDFIKYFEKDQSDKKNYLNLESSSFKKVNDIIFIKIPIDYEAKIILYYDLKQKKWGFDSYMDKNNELITMQLS